MSDPNDHTRDPRIGKPPLPSPDAARARREERDALEEAVSALEGTPPRAEEAPPVPSGKGKRRADTRFPAKDADDENPDSQRRDRLPDRITDRG